MENCYTKRLRVSTAHIDRRNEMGVYHAALLLQDGMTELFYSYECDGVRLSKSHGALWAVARSKIHYDAMPRWMDEIQIKVFPVKVSPVTVHVNMLVETLTGQPLLRCRQELCAIDVTDHSVRRVNTTPFPMDMQLLPPVLDTPFCRRKLAMGEADLAYCHTVRTADTDMNGHMNNVCSVRMLLDAMPSAFWDQYRVREFDIHYVSEGLEGEVLQVFRSQQGDQLDMQVKAGERTLIKAFFTLEAQTLEADKSADTKSDER